MGLRFLYILSIRHWVRDIAKVLFNSRAFLAFLGYSLPEQVMKHEYTDTGSCQLSRAHRYDKL